MSEASDTTVQARGQREAREVKTMACRRRITTGCGVTRVERQPQTSQGPLFRCFRLCLFSSFETVLTLAWK